MVLKGIRWSVIIFSILALIAGSMLLIYPTIGPDETNKRRGNQMTSYLPLLTKKHPHNESSRSVNILGGNATVITPVGFDPLREYSMAATASEMVAERLSQWRDVLLELLRKEFNGNYSEEFVRALERARTGKYNSYLWPVLEWMDRGMTNAQMINEVLERMHRLTRQLSEYRFREGGLYVSGLISKGGTFVLTYCDPPGRVLTTGWNYLHDFERSGWVWIGCFSSSIPDVGHFIGEYCTYTYTTSMSYYWNLARQRCGSSTRSVQVKWFYRAYPMPPDDDWKHYFIWEGNRNEWSEWYTYGDPFTDTSPDPGYYYIKANYYYVLWCCGSSANYCNTHCGRCFACDRDATQHYIGRP